MKVNAERVLKTLITIILFSAVFSGCEFNFVSAENIVPDYGQIVTEDCCFYADASLKIVKFILPYSYYVKIVSVGTEASRVVYRSEDQTCPSAEGYVKNVCLGFNEVLPDSLYPEPTLRLKTDEVVFGDKSLTSPKAVVVAGSSARYYGEIKIDGSDYLYVYVNGYVGYVRKDGFISFDIPLNKVELLPDDNDDKTENSSTEKLYEETEKNFSPSEIIVVAVIIVVGLTLLVFALKPSDKRRSERLDGDD